jgi:predicted aspartyl protease/thioredoxin-like negative regulator of GroEL
MQPDMPSHKQSKHVRLSAAALIVLGVIVIAASSVSAASRVMDQKPRARAERALRSGDFDLAEKLFREILSKDPSDEGARLGLSSTLLKQRNYQDAFDHAARVLAVNPLSPRAHALMGAAVLGSGDFRMSVEEFRTALSLKSDEAMAIAGLAMVDFYENRIQHSVEGLRRAHFLDPDEPDYIYDLAQAAARNENYKEAADSYERFLSIAPHTDSDRRARIRGLIDFLRYLGSQSTLYVSGGASHTFLPFDDASYRPVIKVKVNGSEKQLRFVLDSGSGMCVISEETARKLGLHEVARGGNARAVGGGGRFEIVYGFLSSIDIGEARVSNVPVYIRRFFDDKDQVDGYIGLSVLNKFVATLDYGSQTLSLTREHNANNPPTPPVGSIEIPVRTTSSGFISCEVCLDGITKPLNFIIDTGASISVISEKLAAVDEISGFKEGSRMRVYGAAGIAENVKTLVLPHVSLGSCARERLSVAVLDLDPVNETSGYTQNGIIGENFLRNYRVIFDFQRGIVRLEPLGSSPPQIEGAVFKKLD